jgi:hypothetical protein
MVKLADLFKKLDFNGIKPTLFIDKQDKFKTPIMGTLNLLFFLIAIASFIYFGRELVEYVKPEVTFAQEYSDIPEPYTIDFNNYNIMIDIQAPNWQNYFNDSIYKIEAKYNSYYSNGTFLQKSLPLVPCTETLFGEDNREFYRKTYAENNWCIDRNKINNITLMGRFNNPLYNFVTFYVNSCKNETSTVTCAPQEVIDSYLNGGFISFRSIDNLVDSKNFTNPYFKILTDNFYSFSNRYFKEITLFYKNVDIITDEGIVFESIDQKRFMQLNNIKESLDLRIPEANFFQLVLRLHTTKEIIYRRYTKIQAIIANVGGILKFFSLIIVIINEIYGKHKYFEYIHNQREERHSATKTETSFTVNDKEVTKNNFMRTGEIGTIVNKTIIVDTPKGVSLNKINFSFLEIMLCLRHVSGKTKVNATILKNFKSEIREKLSVMKFINVCDDIDIIKNTLIITKNNI